MDIHELRNRGERLRDRFSEERSRETDLYDRGKRPKTDLYDRGERLRDRPVLQRRETKKDRPV